MAFPPPPPLASTVAAPVDSPARALVFFQLLWRSIVAAVGGGVVIGVGFVVIVGATGERFSDLDSDFDSSDGLSVAMFLAAAFGGAFGLALGVAAGLVLGLIGAIVLVPYRGRRITRLVMRIAAPLLVAAFFVVLLGGDDRVWMLLGGAGMVGAVLIAPWLVGWYVRRMDPSG